MPSPSATIVLRLPRTAYLSVVLLLLGTVPLAFGGDDYRSIEGCRERHRARSRVHRQLAGVFLLIPVAVAFVIARTATIVDADGIRVRALLGTRQMRWDRIRGLSVNGRSVYAVLADGAVRLPCTRLAHLARHQPDEPGPIARAGRPGAETGSRPPLPPLTTEATTPTG